MAGTRRRGGALVAVLWLSAALAAIAFSLASTVRGELERSSTQFDSTQAYYLAAGGLDRALVYMQWGPGSQGAAGSNRYDSPGVSRLHFEFPAGEAQVEIMPESSRINVNRAPPVEILRLLAALGVEPERAAELTQAIVDWRTPPAQAGFTDFDRYYLSLTPSFPSRHASFLEKEELLLVKGMTPDIYHGAFERDARGRLQPVGGLADCVTVLGDSGPVDVNTAPPAVLAAVGLSPQEVDAVVQARRVEPLRSVDVLRAMGLSGGALARLGVGGNWFYSLRSTGRRRTPDGRMSDAVRSVGATVRLAGGAPEDACQILRWNDQLWVRGNQ
ncbi:MAG TPA: type II secretion system protein GspK [Bryobacteraceae bacterium]|nr:type II secretion system protein GspK [Bryobacteraceae bacterium]